MVCKTGILLVIETTWTLDVAFLLPWLLHREFGNSTAGQGFWKTESCERKKRMTQLGALGAVEPLSGHVVVVPLPLCPWYLQSVVMYAWYWSRNFARAGVGAALLRVLGTCQVVLL